MNTVDFIESLRIMFYGMAGIFIVIFFIYLSVLVINIICGKNNKA